MEKELYKEIEFVAELPRILEHIIFCRLEIVPCKITSDYKLYTILLKILNINNIDYVSHKPTPKNIMKIAEEHYKNFKTIDDYAIAMELGVFVEDLEPFITDSFRYNNLKSLVYINMSVDITIKFIKGKLYDEYIPYLKATMEPEELVDYIRSTKAEKHFIEKYHIKEYTRNINLKHLFAAFLLESIADVLSALGQKITFENVWNYLKGLNKIDGHKLGYFITKYDILKFTSPYEYIDDDLLICVNIDESSIQKFIKTQSKKFCILKTDSITEDIIEESKRFNNSFVLNKLEK